MRQGVRQGDGSFVLFDETGDETGDGSFVLFLHRPHQLKLLFARQKNRPPVSPCLNRPSVSPPVSPLSPDL